MHFGHDHDHQRSGAAAMSETPPGAGHNAPPSPRPVQWQTPHRPVQATPTAERTAAEPDIDLVERAFAEGFLSAPDTTSFLRVARIPFTAASADGGRLVLLRVEVEALADVGSITPRVGGGDFRYDPLPAVAVSQRRRLRFMYFDGTVVRALSFEQARELKAAD